MFTTLLAQPASQAGVAAREAPSKGSLGGALVTPHPILFVTQVPLPGDFTSVNAVFGNHKARVSESTRGGDLWIRYPDGTLKNLTEAAGYGTSGFQGLDSIAVRDPSVHWGGTKAVFAMAVGSVEDQYELADWRWQLYEVTGLAESATPVITKVANQPEEWNNVSPVYTSDDRIVYVSDRPRAGLVHLYPQLDEYERAPSNSGLWSLDPATGDLRHIDHSPSGDFDPIVDSFGRLVFTRWDHLERDQLADADAGPVSDCYGGAYYGSFNYSDESESATILPPGVLTEHFPEPRGCRNDLLAGTNLDGHAMNHFLPWMANQDGTELETLNHVGRHELHGYLGRTFNNDPDVVEYYGQYARTNPNSIVATLQMAESASEPGTFYAINGPEFGTHASGQVVRLEGGPSVNPDDMVVTYVTHPATASTSDTPGPEHTGLQRDPLGLSDGTLVVSHTSETREDRNTGTTENPGSRYAYRLRTLVPGAGGHHVPGELLTTGISKEVSWWDPDRLVSYSGELWELNAVEVRPRPRAASPVPPLPGPEASAFAAAGVDVAAFRAYLESRELALVVSRDVTTRDDQDLQQPYNLRVPGGVETVGTGGRVYDVRYMQFFQADQIRGTKGCCGDEPQPGRRVLAQPLHDAAALACDPTPPTGPEGSKWVETDGSLAAIVPARRALTWQLTDPAGEGVVRERYWLSFQPGEVRVCTSCHGINGTDQAGNPKPTNEPLALRRLLDSWLACADGTGALLRNKEVTDLDPITPALSTIFPLDPVADVHVAGFRTGGVDPQDDVVTERGRPLVFYGVTGTGVLKAAKNGAGRVALHF